MSEFRKLFLALALVALCAATASAQPITCSTTAQPLTMRAEGLSELGGDVVLSCTGGAVPAPGDALPQVNISVTLTTNLTSRIIAGTSLMEATLLIDDPAAANNPLSAAPGVLNEQFAGAPGTNGFTPGLVATAAPAAGPGVGGATTTAGGTGRAINVYQGLQQNANTVVFLGVPINAPGAGAFRVFRIKNLRAAVSGASAPNGQVFAFLSIQNPPANLQLNSASGVVGFVQTGLTYALRNSGDTGSLTVPSFAQCATLNNNLAVNGSTATSLGTGAGLEPTFNVRFTEGYAGAWKPRGFTAGQLPAADQFLPNFNYNTESGWYNTGPADAANLHGSSGIASHGTRLRAVFNNVPANVFVYRGVAARTSALAATTAYGVVADSFGANPGAGTVLATPTALFGVAGVAIPAVPAGLVRGYEQVIISGGTGAATWEIFAADPNQVDQLTFPIHVAFRASANPGLGTATVNGTFAPISSVSTASSSAPIPRFTETGTAGNAFTVASCVTNLLFPYVTNQAGFDTGMAITNTSTDPFSTTAQQGTCTLNYYGVGAGGGAAPSPQTTTSNVTSTSLLALSLFNGGNKGIQATPGFEGYIIAQCNFRYAHGFAFISDVGAGKLSHGYLALVMDNFGAFDAINRTGVTGEHFGQ